MSLEERFDRFATNYDKDAVQQVCQELFDQEMDYFNLHDDQTLTLSVILAQLLYSNNLFVNHGRFFFGIWVNAFVRLYPSLYRVPSDEQLSAYILMNFLQFFAYVFDYEKVAIEIECEVVSFVPNLFDRDELLIIWHGKQVRFADTKKIKDALQTAGRIKSLLYAYRVSLTGIHLLRTGQVNADVRALAPLYGLDHLLELVAAKSAEHLAIPLNVEEHDRMLQHLQELMQEAFAASPLPETPTNRAALDDFVLRVRLACS